jgi:hypothetical protein
MLCVASLPRLSAGAVAAGVRGDTGVRFGADVETDRAGVGRSGVGGIDVAATRVGAIGVGWLIGGAHAPTIKIATINKIKRRIIIAPSPERCT